MAHFAELDENNIVTNVIVIHNNELLDKNGNELEQKGIDFCTNLLGGRWVQTSFNNKIRKNYAATGFLYDPIRDAFIPPKPFESWALNEETCQWEAPTPRPTIEPYRYIWVEENLAWVDIL